MAEFSKQYVENYMPEFGSWDFDLDAEFSKLSPGQYEPMICEGFGFIAIIKQLDGSRMCLYKNHETKEFREVTYESLTDTTHEDIWKE